MEQPVISFEGYEIKKYHYDKKDETTDVLKDPFTISVKTGMTDELDAGIVTANVIYETEEITVDIIVAGFFKIIEKNEKAVISNYLAVNGTAMLFPYIRSMISMLTSLDSEKAIMLPTINTTNLLKSVD